MTTELDTRTEKQQEVAARKAFNREIRIKRNVSQVAGKTWELAKDLYELHEGGEWALLGHDTLEDFLAQPDLGIQRTHFFRLTKMWRDLVVVRQIEPEKLKALEPTKVAEVTPAIMRGDVKVDDALSDAEVMSKSDLREKFRKAKPGSDPDDTKLDATAEPDRIKCETCGSWYIPDEVEEA